jgi:hypothetical protein
LQYANNYSTNAREGKRGDRSEKEGRREGWGAEFFPEVYSSGESISSGWMEA